MSDASREADGYEVGRSSADQHTAGEQSVENDALVVRRARAHVPYGPKHLSADEADADYLRAAVSNIEFSRCMGSNLTATVAAILNDLADQIDRRAIPPAVPATPNAGDASATCCCRIVGWSRDPYEPHIASQPDWEQADDCPVHPLAASTDASEVMILDPIEPTAIGPGLAAIPLGATVWDDAEDGQHAVTSNGIVFQRRKGLWHMDPWWQNNGDGAQIAAVCADPDDWAFDLGWPRKNVEDAHGPLTYIKLPKEMS